MAITVIDVLGDDEDTVEEKPEIKPEQKSERPLLYPEPQLQYVDVTWQS
jgi:hypothetical protein